MPASKSSVLPTRYSLSHFPHPSNSIPGEALWCPWRARWRMYESNLSCPSSDISPSLTALIDPVDPPYPLPHSSSTPRNSLPLPTNNVHDSGHGPSIHVLPHDNLFYSPSRWNHRLDDHESVLASCLDRSYTYTHAQGSTRSQPGSCRCNTSHRPWSSGSKRSWTDL